jgi:transposase
VSNVSPFCNYSEKLRQNRIAIVRMKTHEPTQAYIRKRTLEGKTKKEIIRCLKRYIVREIFNCLCRPNSPQKTI